MHICIRIFMHVPKYNLLSLYTVICMHVYSADHLAPSNKLVCSSLKIISPTESKHSLVAYVLCIELRPQELPPLRVSMSDVVLLVRLCLGRHVGETLWA